MPDWLRTTLARLDPWQGQRLPALVLIALLALRYGDPAVLEAARLQTFDFFQRLAPISVETGDIVLVDIDERSLAAVGQWPWPRDRLALLLDGIANAGPKAVGFDILFAEPDQHSPESFVAEHPSLPEPLRSALARLPSHDRLFAESLARAPSVLGIVAGFGAEGDDSGEAPAVPTTIVEVGGDAAAHLPAYDSLLRDVALLEAASTGLAVINLGFEADGVIRRIPLVVRVRDRLLPSLTLELLALSAPTRSVSLHIGATGLSGAEVNGVFVPTDRQGRLWARFSPAFTYRSLSAVDLLNDQSPLTDLTDKIVLIGSTAAGVADYVPTPIGVAMPSLLIHANALSTILNQTALVRPPLAFFAELFCAILLSLLLMMVQRRFRVRATVMVFFLLVCAIPAVAWSGFQFSGWLLDPTFPILVVALVFPAVVSASLVNEERRRREAVRQAEHLEREKEARIRSLQAELLRTTRASSIGHLSSALSHELNQPLAAVYNFLQAARNLARKNDAEAIGKLDGLLEKALAQAQRGSSILKGMREVVEHGETSTAGADINQIVEEAIDLSRVPGQLQNILLRVSLSPGLPPVFVNRVQIHQVLTNLIQNAVEAMDLHGELTLTTEPADHGSVQVSVNDRGTGLSVEAEANLFKPFNTTKPTGMGLGLSICRAIIEAHGGRLWAEPRDGGGTSFSFTLPTRSTAADAPASGQTSSAT